jgi:hypothetical protein
MDGTQNSNSIMTARSTRALYLYILDISCTRSAYVIVIWNAISSIDFLLSFFTLRFSWFDGRSER